MSKVVIIGCGWLGMQVAEVMCKSGFEVWGSTSNAERQQKLKAIGATPFQLADLNGNEPQAKQIIVGVQAVFIALPPSAFGVENYAKEVERITQCFEDLQQLIFCSSTSVYSENAVEVNEATPVQPETANAVAIVAAEQIILSAHVTSAYILRLGGLYGIGRNPAKYLQGREGVAAPLKPVNLIDGATIAQVVLQLIATEIDGGIYNVVNPQHPTRAAYYTAICNQLGLVSPTFVAEDKTQGKIVSAEKLLRTLNVQTPDLLP